MNGHLTATRMGALATAIIMVTVAMAGCGDTVDPSAEIPLDTDDIGGVVSSSNGVEAGVWVVAETTDLPTRFIRTVVTDDNGRYVLPDLPEASYEVFVRGYGLLDSSRVDASPGQRLDLDAVVASDPLEAAQVYPAAGWLSMIVPIRFCLMFFASRS